MIIITVITITMTQVNLAQSGMGLASVEQQWSCLLPNLIVKDQVVVVVNLATIVGIVLMYVMV